MADASNTQCCGFDACPRRGAACACTNCRCLKSECSPNCRKLCCADSQGKCGNAGCKCGAACKCAAGACASGCKKGCCGD
uniref:Metallothionein n=1 Tax=Lumbricus rubellus TaxID=35632 RepID=O76956_LUMRU|nr:metallothionein [Lumbricus rubellus]